MRPATFRSYLSKLSQHGVYRPMDANAWGKVKTEESFNPNNRELTVPNDRHIPLHMTEVPRVGNGAAEASQARSGVSSNPPASADRSQRFLKRVDRELVGLDPLQREAFLRRKIDEMEKRYSRFIRTQGKSEYCANPKNPIHVNDFIDTIAGLHKRWNLEV